MKYIARLGILLLGFCAVPALLSSSVRAVDPDEAMVERHGPVALNFEAGAWRTKSQLVFEAATKTLARKTYTVWDPMPSRDLDFVWTPDAPASGAERVTGKGRLIWRHKGKPAYDPTSIYAEYRGQMKDGRPEGRGIFIDHDGVSYDGNWTKGLLTGQGRLQFGNGAEYVGQFQAGRAHGQGRYFDVDGEMFEGVFQQGLRNGAGTTVLPSGRSYRSQWVNGEEIASSRKLRLAQLGQPKGTTDNLRLAIVVGRLPTDSTALGYAASSSESGLSIVPDNKRLMAVWKGNDEIQLTEDEEEKDQRGRYGVFALTKGDLPPMNLILEVQNRATAPIQVRGAFLDVESSVTDLQPAIQLTAGSDSSCGQRERPRYSPRFDLENFGWGPAEQAKLRFAFVNPSTSVRPGNMPVTKNLGNIGAGVRVDLEAELRAAGVRIDVLKQNAAKGFTCKSTTATECLAELRATGAFGTLAGNLALNDTNISVNAAGILEYAWKDPKGVSSTRQSPFTVNLLLGRVKQEAECGEGGEKDPVYKKPLELRLDQTRYRLPVAFQRNVPAGSTSRFELATQAPKSSQHNFRVVLQLADGREITSRPINLLYFMPNWYNRRVR